MKKIALAAVAALACVASPAFAQTTSGTGTGIGGSLNIGIDRDLSIGISDSTSVSTGSGYSGSMRGVADNSISGAVFASAGLAGVHTDVTNLGTVNTGNASSYHLGGSVGLAFGEDARFSADTMNFAQGAASISREFSFEASDSFNLDLAGNLGNWSFKPLD